MSRGPLPSKGFDAALPVARARGHVEYFRRMRGNTADLMVSGSGILSIIRIQNAPRLYGTPAEIAREFSDTIARLRVHPAGGPVSRELWLYSRYGVLRFFRVLDNGIVELGADGNVLAAGPVVPAPAGRARTGKKIPAVPEQSAHEKNPADMPAGEKVPALPKQPAACESTAMTALGGEEAAVLREPAAADGPGGQDD
jgi:hypothetical protein